jgi:hypothetical protein
VYELLLDDFSAENGDFCFHDKNLVGKFKQWLQTQESLHWAKVANAEA